MDYEHDDSDEVQQVGEGEAVPGVSESDADIVQMVRKCRKESDKHLTDWLIEAKQMFAMVAGDQWEPNDKAALEEMGRLPVVFNRVGAVVDSVCGSEVSNRQQVQYIPRQAGDSGVNDVLTGAASWVRDNCDAEDEESDAFFDTVVCGLGWTETRLDYVDDPEGQVLIDRADPLSVRYDPAAKKRNLADKRWVQRDAWLCKEEIEEKWGDIELPSPGAQDLNAPEESKPHDASNAWTYRDNASGYDANTGKFLVIHHQWFTLETYYKAVDPATGQIVELDGERMEAITAAAKKMGAPAIESVKLQRKLYKQAFVCGSTVLEKSKLPTQAGGFTLQAITGKRDRNSNTWYGLVRPMADPQRWANKFFSQILHIINTNAKGGLMVEEGATDNVRKLEDDWAKPDSIVTLNPGAISGGKVLPKPAAAYPLAPEKMMEFAVTSIRDTSGVNLEQMGLADREQAGYLEAQRKQAGLIILATFFDSLRRYRKRQGRVLADFIINYLSDGRLVRIVGGDGTEKYIPLLRQPDMMKFDVVVDESPTSHNVKERVFGMLMQMLPAMQKLGMPPPPAEMIDYLPIPASFAEKWKAQMVEAQNKPPQPDPRVAIEMQKLAVKQQSDAADRQADERIAALRAEMQARVDMNRDASQAQQNAQDREQEFSERWREALLAAATKIEVANIGSKAKVQNQATEDATARLAGEI